ncbi:MAG: hydroxysqualene dehydroxylase HpnE [Pseudomonadota bacterium]
MADTALKPGAPIGNARAIAVVGAGWAGCAAAVELAERGCQVTLYEAARTLGGRARAVEIDGRTLDNGQHILLGAYRSTIDLMRRVGIDPRKTLLTLPLQMRYPPNSGGMDFLTPRWPAPLHVAVALLRTRGLARADKLALARFSTTVRWMGWQLDHDCSVSELLARFDQTARLIQLLWRPLCLAALNTAPERASAQVFLNVLRDSLGARRSASDMLLPRLDLSALFPAAAARFIGQRGGAVRTASAIDALRQNDDGRWQLAARADGGADGAPWSAPYHGVVLATPAGVTGALLTPLPGPLNATLLAQLAGFEHEAISTCYLQYDAGLRLALPFYALIDDAAAGQWGQFVFDRGQLDPSQAGLLAVVISAAGAAAELDRAALAQAIAQQLAGVFGLPALAAPIWHQLITEKRATFACLPALARPPNATAYAGLAIAGDYTASDYPATIEAAVRSGLLAAACVAPA